MTDGRETRRTVFDRPGRVLRPHSDPTTPGQSTGRLGRFDDKIPGPNDWDAIEAALDVSVPDGIGADNLPPFSDLRIMQDIDLVRVADDERELALDGGLEIEMDEFENPFVSSVEVKSEPTADLSLANLTQDKPKRTAEYKAKRGKVAPVKRRESDKKLKDRQAVKEEARRRGKAEVVTDPADVEQLKGTRGNTLKVTRRASGQTAIDKKTTRRTTVGSRAHLEEHLPLVLEMEE